MLNRFTAYSQYKPPPVSLLQIGGIDARSVQKTPAGVLVVRRGLFFVKRQRRYAAYLQKGQKGLDTRIVGGIILTAHSSQLTAHSSQRECYLDNFLSVFHTHNNVSSSLKTLSSYKFAQQTRYCMEPPPFVAILKRTYYINLLLLSSFYRNARYAVWFDTG